MFRRRCADAAPLPVVVLARPATTETEVLTETEEPIQEAGDTRAVQEVEEEAVEHQEEAVEHQEEEALSAGLEALETAVAMPATVDSAAIAAVTVPVASEANVVMAIGPEIVAAIGPEIVAAIGLEIVAAIGLEIVAAVA
jgi:hypothetical protein